MPRADAAVIIHTDYWSPYGWTARHVATEKGVGFSVATVARASQGIRSLHPFGKMPVLTHGDVTIYETLAIAHYLDRGFAGPPLQPNDCLAQSQVLTWISVVNAYVFPLLNALVKQRTFSSLGGGKPDEAALAEMRAPLAMQLGLIEEAALSHRFLVGNDLTIADSFLLPILHFAAFTPEGAEALEAAPSTRRWLERMRERPSFAATEPFAQMAG